MPELEAAAKNHSNEKHRRTKRPEMNANSREWEVTWSDCWLAATALCYFRAFACISGPFLLPSAAHGGLGGSYRARKPCRTQDWKALAAREAGGVFEAWPAHCLLVASSGDKAAV